MAKMTKEQKQPADPLDPLMRAREERRERERFSYTPKLLAVVGRAMSAGIGVEASVNAQNEGKFSIRCDWDTYELPLMYTPENYFDLERAEKEVAMAEERLAEALRLEEVRKQALAKLTKEERLALGIGSAI